MTARLSWRVVLAWAVGMVAGYLIASDARATWYEPPRGNYVEQQQTANPFAQGGTSTADATSSAVGGDGGSVALNTQGTYTFRALALDFPGLDGDNCIGGAQGGADDGGRGAFLGINYIIDPCYYQKLAAAETNVDTHARLKCADAKYRAAVAYHISRFRRHDRRAYCIERVKADVEQVLEQVETCAAMAEAWEEGAWQACLRK